jgi:topoisomerase IA-like protein
VTSSHELVVKSTLYGPYLTKPDFIQSPNQHDGGSTTVPAGSKVAGVVDSISSTQTYQPFSVTSISGVVNVPFPLIVVESHELVVKSTLYGPYLTKPDFIQSPNQHDGGSTTVLLCR